MKSGAGKEFFMDKTDEKILRLLAENADASASDLSQEINLSVPAINKRIARLKEEKVIRKTTLITDPKAVGKSVAAFILVKIASFEQSQQFPDTVRTEADALECYAVSGEYDYLLKICAADIDDLETKLLKIKAAGGVTSHTMMCLREYKFEAAMLP